MQRIAQGLLAAAVGVSLFASKASADNINVVVNGEQVSFAGAQPQEMNGSVLVPLRGVFEQLGATVQYNPTSKTIFADKGATNVSLSLGSSTAYVNNQSQPLPHAPIVMDGTTLVPLRFIAESLGAYVGWNPDTNTVNIQSAGAASARDIPAQGIAQSTTIVGRITDVDRSGGHDVLSVDTDSGATSVKVNDDTQIETQSPGSQPIPSTPEVLHVGDRIKAELRPDGDARSIQIRSVGHATSSISGRVTNVDNIGDPTQITVETSAGSVQVGIDQNTGVRELQARAGASESATPGALRVGDNVSVQLRPDGTARAIDITVDEHRGHVISVQNLPDGVTAIVLDNGKTYLSDGHTRILHDHQDLGRSIQAGDVVTIRLRSSSRTGYSIDVE
jgi:hypothetical protein